MWILIGAGVLGVIILVAVSVPLLGKLSELRRAGDKLQRRQAEAMKLQAAAQELEQNLLGLQQRAETMQERVVLVKAGRDDSGKHAWPKRLGNRR